MTDEEREFGVVKVFDELKGFGFVRRNKGKDVFIFYGDIDGENRILGEGDYVSFNVEKTPKGPRGKAIKKEG
ncbi:retron Se72 family effector protein [Wenzhouxiangella sp. EGI_FJ10305]|uniref:retron Se72 family effector protein n=1 Tax=Wenzhouxiangella sp. EGI_FJ10305 TaxID=3243768 RepID=UPI0035E07FC3